MGSDAKPPIGKRDLVKDNESMKIRVPSGHSKIVGNGGGSRPKLAKVNPTRQKQQRLLPRQVRFVREYLIDLSPADAYIRSGYEVTDRKSAYTLACRLMKNPQILEAIDQQQHGMLNRLEIDADWAILRFKAVFLLAMNKGDLANACVALRNIGQHLGLYERDNKQKVQQYTQADLDRLKSELTEAGFDFTRINFVQGGVEEQK